MGTFFVYPVDPDTLDKRFAAPEPEEIENPNAPDPEWSPDIWARYEAFLDELPPIEADMVELYFFRRCRQADLATIFEMTQAAVSYRLKHAAERLEFLSRWPGATMKPSDVVRDLTEHLDDQTVDILAVFLRTRCQVHTAIELRITQGKARHRIFRAVDQLGKLKDEYPELAAYHETFAMLCEARQILTIAQYRNGHPANRERLRREAANAAAGK